MVNNLITIHFPDIHSTEQELKSPILDKAGIQLIIKREDLLHPFVSGNKWRKLKYNIEESKRGKFKQILTFGGAFSNHIYAAAAAGQLTGIPTIGMIRGEKTEPLNPTLSFAQSCGMKLHYLNREEYRKRNSPEFITELLNQFPDSYYVPEGGSNELGVKGCEEIIQDIENDFDILTSAVGSGGTVAGLISGLNGNKSVLGFSALKGQGILDKDIFALLPPKAKHLSNWSVNYDYHFGGYAKINAELVKFILNFKIQFQITLEPVYTGKMMFGLFDLIQKGYFNRGTRILAIHTGGLQGNAGFPELNNHF